MANIYTPKEVADQLDVTTQSVRRYTDKLGKHLSPGATGRPRQFTPEDVYVLRTAASWLAAGMTYDDVDQRLDGLAMPDNVADIVLASGDETETAPAVPEALAILGDMRDVMTALAAAQVNTDAIRQRLDELAALQTAQHTAHMRDVEAMAQRLRQTQAETDARLASRVPVSTAIMLVLLGVVSTLVIVAVSFLLTAQ